MMTGFTHSGTTDDWQGPRVQSCRSQWGCGAITTHVVLNHLCIFSCLSEAGIRSLSNLDLSHYASDTVFVGSGDESKCIHYYSRFSVHRQTVLLHNIEGLAEKKKKKKRSVVAHVTTIRNNLAVLFPRTDSRGTLVLFSLVFVVHFTRLGLSVHQRYRPLGEETDLACRGMSCGHEH
jgi:hypothetical protein